MTGLLTQHSPPQIVPPQLIPSIPQFTLDAEAQASVNLLMAQLPHQAHVLLPPQQQGTTISPGGCVH